MKSTVSFRHIFYFGLFISQLILVCAAGDVIAQTEFPPEVKLQLAKNLERQGNLEKALDLYRELYKTQPGNPSYVNNFKRLLERLKKYEEWISVLDAQLARQPNHATLLGDRGRVLYLWGKEDEAKEIWENIIRLNPGNQHHYRLVSSMQQRVRLYDEAVNTLLRGRKHLRQPALFANELANLYQYRRNYGMAAREWLNWVSADNRYIQMAERVINSFPADSAVVAEVTEALESTVSDSTGNVHFRRLLAGYYIKNREYDKAFESYRILDDQLNADGMQILSFANQIYQIGRYNNAIRAYTYFLNTYPDNKMLVQGSLGLARALERSGFAETADEPDSARAALLDMHRRQAVAEYDKIIQKYPNSPFALEAHFHKGDILFNHIFDLDGAIAQYEKVRQISPNSDRAWDAMLKMGDCYVAKGDLDQAERYYSLVKTNARSIFNTMVTADFNLLKIEYYRGNFDTLKEQLNILIETVPRKTNLSNDLIAMSIMLEENLANDPEPLKKYALAEFLVRQRKLTEALALLKLVYQDTPGHPAADDVLLLTAELLTAMEKYTEAIDTYMLLVDNFPLSTLLEPAYRAAGILYEEKLRDYTQAIGMYESFLVNFGESIYLEEIRSRLRRLQQAVS